MLRQRRIASLGVITAMVLSLVAPGVGVARTRGSTEAVAARPAIDNVMFGERRITVPSGGHFYGSSFQVMTPDGGHVFVRSSSDLSVAPDVTAPGMFDLIGGRAVRVACGGCTSIPGTTTDGTAIVGMSPTALVPADTDATPDLYLFDAAGPHLITPGVNGSPAFKAMSDDGSFVVFAINIQLDPADTDATADLYRWTRATSTVQLVSQGAIAPTFEYLSPDGARVLFSTGENILSLDLGASGQPGIYQWTAAAVTLRGRGTFFSASPDGARVYSNTTAALALPDADTQMDAYVHDSSGFTVLSEPSSQNALLAAVKADGSSWVIATNENLTLNDTDATKDLYILTSSSRNLLSRGALDADGIIMDAAFTTGIYYTASPLVAGDTDAWADVYRWSASSIEDPRLLSGDGIPDVTTLAYAPDGSRAFMTSSGQQLPADTDPNPDVYEYVANELRLALPGDQAYNVNAWTADLQRLIVSAGALTNEDTNGNTLDVYLSDADLVPPTATIVTPPFRSLTGPDATLSFGTAAGDGVFYDCRVDGGAWSPCTSPHLVPDLSEAMHHLDVRAWDAAANSDDAGMTWQVDATPPVGTAYFDGNGYVNRSTYLGLNFPATDNLSGVGFAIVSNDQVNWTTFYYNGKRAWNLIPGDGTKHVWVYWKDGVGNMSDPQMITVVLDTTPPTVTVPNQSFPLGGALSSGSLPIKVTWTGADATSGIAHYEIDRQSDGGPYAILSTSLTSPSFTTALSPYHSYRFRVRAIDRAGVKSAWIYGPTFNFNVASETGATVLYTGTWYSAHASAYWGGAVKYATAAGAKAKYTFTGRAVAWIAAKGPTRGKAAIYVNGGYFTTVDLYAPSAQYQRVAWSGKWSTSATRTLEIRPLATPTRPRVDVDGFAVTN